MVTQQEFQEIQAELARIKDLSDSIIFRLTQEREQYKRALEYLLARVEKEEGCLHEFETCTAGYYSSRECATCGAQKALGKGFQTS